MEWVIPPNEEHSGYAVGDSIAIGYLQHAATVISVKEINSIRSFRLEMDSRTGIPQWLPVRLTRTGRVTGFGIGNVHLVRRAQQMVVDGNELRLETIK